METKISTSAPFQQEQFLAFIKALIAKYQPTQIYCFGRAMQQDFKQGCFIRAVDQLHHQYYLLVVTAGSTRSEHDIQDFATNHFQMGTVAILAHTREAVAQALKTNNRFFTTVCSLGELLYTHDGMVQAIPSVTKSILNPAEQAEKYYLHRKGLALGFLASTRECQIKELYPLAAFMLHQVVEQCCVALIGVHLGYRSDVHNLHRQLRLCSCFSPAPAAIFLSGAEEDQRLFERLVKSYTAARYHEEFKVSKEDAQQLFIRVSTFLKLTEIMCQEKIKDLTDLISDMEESKLPAAHPMATY